MDRPTRRALAAIALGFGVLWAGLPVQSPALAQVVEAPATPSPSADGVDVSTLGAHAVETSPGAPSTAEGVDASAVAPQPAETPTETSTAASPPAADGVDASVGTAPEDAPPVATAAADGVDASAEAPRQVEQMSATAAQLAGWVLASGDNGGLPFVIVDKLAADVFTFDADGNLQGASPVLVGLTAGDDATPGVGDREMSAIPPEERTTPAGRFLASFGGARGRHKVLWVDYTTAISLHPVVTAHPEERRLERLQSAAPEDRRITYGCINVPTAFYKDVVLKVFGGGNGVVYILPDTKTVAEVFPAFAALAPNYASGGRGAQLAAGPLTAPPIPTAAPAAASDASQGAEDASGSAPTAATPPDTPEPAVGDSQVPPDAALSDPLSRSRYVPDW